MRPLVLLFSTLTLLLAAAPASADHMGPCTHQYAEIVIYGVLDYKNGGLGRIAPGVIACLQGTPNGVHELVGPILP